MKLDLLKSLVLVTEVVYLASLGFWEQPCWSSGRREEGRGRSPWLEGVIQRQWVSRQGTAHLENS